MSVKFGDVYQRDESELQNCTRAISQLDEKRIQTATDTQLTKKNGLFLKAIQNIPKNLPGSSGSNISLGVDN